MGSSNSVGLKDFFGALALTLWASQLSAKQDCAIDRVLIKGDFGEARFSIELADDPAERGQGLMHRDSMARSAGMLFIFERPQPVAFWMKNTLIPLDMIFTDKTGRILHIHENAIPHDLTPISGGGGVFAVLEINGGLSAIYGFEVGDALQHPSLSEGSPVILCKE